MIAVLIFCQPGALNVFWLLPGHIFRAWKNTAKLGGKFKRQVQRLSKRKVIIAVKLWTAFSETFHGNPATQSADWPKTQK